MTKQDYTIVCNFIDSIRKTMETHGRNELNEKYNIVPEKYVYNVIQDLKGNVGTYLYGHGTQTIYWHQPEKRKFKILVSFAMVYGVYEYLNDEFTPTTQKSRCDMKKLRYMVTKYKETGLAQLLQGDGFKYPYPYTFPFGDPYEIFCFGFTEENRIKRFLEQKTGEESLIRQFYNGGCSSLSDRIPTEEKDIAFVKNNKETLVKYAIPEILDLYLTWVQFLYDEFYKHTQGIKR